MDFLKSFHEEFGWFIWGLLGIALIWFFMGGANNPTAHEGQFIKPPAPLNTGEVYGDYYAGAPTAKKETLNLPESPADAVRKASGAIESFLSESEKAKDVHVTSLLAKGLSFDGTAGAKRTGPNDEYLRIVSSEHATAPIALSGLVLRGTGFGTAIELPKADEFLVLGTSPKPTDVMLPAGGRALISSGRSPVGASFRVNSCSGYLDQFQNYTPALINECPSPSDEFVQSGPISDSACRAFVEKLPRCRIYQGTFPATLSPACQAFVTEKLNYNSCAMRHKDDDGFDKNEWRLFLGSESELWRDKNEIIRLLDSRGNTVDAITY